MQTVPLAQVLAFVLGPVVLSFLIWVLYHFHVDGKRFRASQYHQNEATMENNHIPEGRNYSYPVRTAVVTLAILFTSLSASAQGNSANDQAKAANAVDLEKKVEDLQNELDQLKKQLLELHNAHTPTSPITQRTTTSATLEQPKPAIDAAPKSSLSLPLGATVNVILDGYYEYNTNHPAGRVNSLRAYDVLSNAFSLNQAGVIFELPTAPEEGRRFGGRVDLQFGQATATLQGNPANENRPDIYRNVFQAYGRYVAPLGKGLTVDFGKWASSLGYEANYTKDQLNYTRSFYFYFLPFYHMGLRANYQLNDKVAFNYWLTNGTQQTEPFNSFKDEMFGLNLTPTKSINWTVNYYLGQEHPDVATSSNCGTAPLQPGLCFTPIADPQNGKTHIFDTYASWQVTPKLLLGGEADYVIQRQWANAAPGESSAPSHTDGGAAYASYQLTPSSSLAARTEYLSDRGGLFSGTTQALKEVTTTYTHHFGDGFQAMLEYRRDWSNQAFFPRGTAGAHVNHQDTATLGLVWWYGGKKGAW
ncbi:outer membrane beta-barrel protein [Terriglobus sp. TAA 43]|uniref:outer membrane beta-barrel protein n=1 Tax=Terriglobus sp. TAA 43 TaxID=278961 RepID=UPI000647D74F|nr:outer membrane beta-barrel protein [Terriglobus sp. TAA 43]